MLKKIIQATTLAGALFFPTARAHAHDITLQYDYFENKQNTTFIEQAPSNLEFDTLITNADNYNDFIADTNTKNLLTTEKIQLIAHLGDLATENYDNSKPFKEVNFDRVFANIQHLLQTGERQPSGAICGGIHHVMMRTAQQLNLEAVTYTGRSKNNGTGHVFTSIHGNDGFDNLSYGEVMHTNTHNFYQALILSQRAQGRADLDHRIYDDEFLYRYFPPDAQHFFRYTDFNPDINKLTNSLLLQPHTPKHGISLVAGNTELSLAGAINPEPFVLFAKIGRMNGQKPSALRDATLLEGGLGVYHHKDDTFLDARIALVYGLFNERNTDEDRIFILSDISTGTKWTINKNIKLGTGARLFTATDIPDSLKDNDQMLGIFDITGMGSLEIGQTITFYTTAQGIGGLSNVREQQPTIHLGDIETGLAYKHGSYLIKTASRIKPEAYTAEITLTHHQPQNTIETLSLTARHGWGRHNDFTPDYTEAEAELSTHLNDNITLKTNITYRNEKWTRDETNHQGSGQLTLEIKF